MNAYCPECETDLDQATGICPACRWDPLMQARLHPVVQAEPQLSLTERYRGTTYDISVHDAAVQSNTGVSKGRAFVIVSLVAGACLYGLMLSMMGSL
jgi:hypothetical protein